MATNLLLDPQILAALLTVAAAAAGYFLREWLTRSKPFVSVIHIEGSSRRVSARVPVPEKALKASKRSHLLDELADRSRLDEVFDTLSGAKAVDSRAQEIIELIESFSAAVARGDSAASQNLLEKLMIDEDFDNWICLLLGERTVAVPAFDPSLPVVVECGEEAKARGGTFAIGFPGNTLRFGSGLNNFILHKSSVKALVELVARLEFAKISQVLTSVATELIKETSISKDVIPPLQEIVDKNSQWSFRLYVANLGNAPFLIQTNAEVEIKDQSGGRYLERCFMILLKQQAEGKVRRVRADAPLVTQSQHDITLDFVTMRTQAEMPTGDTIRSMFKSGTAQCRVTFRIERPGHARNAKVTSEWVNFVNTRPSAA